jgi:hypothetical protein
MKNKYKLLFSDPGALLGAAIVIAIFVLAGAAGLWIKGQFG